MRSINKVILIGNLTRNPEIRQTPDGQTVCTFSIATNRDWITKDGQRHNTTEYHDLVAWGKLAEICQQTLTKGKLIYIEGYLKTRVWETPEQIKKYKTETVIQDMIILSKRTDQAIESQNQNNEPHSAPTKSNTHQSPEINQNSEISIDSDLGL